MIASICFIFSSARFRLVPTGIVMLIGVALVGLRHASAPTNGTSAIAPAKVATATTERCRAA